MNEEVLGKLGDDRKVLYEGHPDNIKAMDNTHKKGNIIRICVLMAIAIALSVVYSVSNANPKTGIIAFLIAVFAYAACSEVLNVSKIKKLSYYITEKHIVYGADSTFSVVPLNTIKQYEFKTDSDGHSYLLCGKVKKGMYGLRSMALVPSRPTDNGICDPFVIYAMTDSETFKKVFEEQMKKAE